MRRFIKAQGLGLILLLVAACAQDEVILPGERLDIRADAAETAVQDRAAPIRLPAQTVLAAWPQRGGNASHNMPHAALAASPSMLWQVPIGQGDDRRHRITASPVAADGRIFTLDALATVTAVSTAGQPLWSRDLTPASDRAGEASGGGLAVAGDALLVTTGFGELVALGAADGAVRWRQRLGAPAAGAPTVRGGLVYVVTRDSRAWAVGLADGRVRWELPGAPSLTGIVGGAAPAVDDRLAVFPFGSAQVLAAFPKGGFELWSGSVAGQRLGRAYAQIGDVTGDPVLTANAVYVGSPSGRTVALDRVSGERLWTADEGAMGPPWLAGGSLFTVSDRAELVRLDAATGRRIWGARLPQFVPETGLVRRQQVYAHFGPVLAGGRLWVAGGDGKLRGFDPRDGSLAVTLDLPAGAATQPIVADRMLYVVTRDGQLVAFR